MKNCTLFIAFVLCCSALSAQINPASPWVWMKGDNTVDQYGVYGTAGVPGSLNKPGARNIASTWRDAAGNLWMLGGMGLGKSSSGFLNDLWKFDPVALKWTWVNGDDEPEQYSVYGTKGVPAAPNKPGGLYSGISWVDKDGNFWLFGGYGYTEDTIGLLNTLWKYDLAQNEWKWVNGDKTVNMTGDYGTRGVAGSTTKPGARYCSISWTDSNGDLWLFGGFGFGSGPNWGALNDVWKYSVATNQWTWIKGDSITESKAIYGTKNVSSASANPGGRYLSTSWKDRNGMIWVYGGYGFDENNLGFLNDLWKYDPAANTWTWVSGDNITDQPGLYGSQGTAAITNKPGGRYTASSWIDQAGDFWLFGGYGYDTTDVGYLNDLWRYHPATGEWTWIKGDKVIDQPAVYGTQCKPDTSNKSGARMSSISWTDGIGNLWLFGGYGFDSNNSGNLNDLWKVSSNQFLLPIRLLDFSGVLYNDMVSLQWQTEEEMSFSRFTIERSFDGTSFSAQDDVKSTGHSGQYNWQDYDLLHHTWQKVFYRLKIVSNDGHFSYSKTLLFDKRQQGAVLYLYPNPAASTLNLSFTQKKQGPAVVTILDMKGSVVKKLTEFVGAGKVSVNLDITALPAATYIASVYTDGNTIRQPFIRQ